jgi:hypothetical protein
MAPDEQGLDVAPRTALGAFRVHVDDEAVTLFCRETGFEEVAGSVVPAGFPAVWLSSPEIYDAIRRELASEDSVPVHEHQSFDYSIRLERGESYRLTAALRRENAPPRLIVDADVATLEGELCLRVETWLRIVPRPTGGGP